MRIKAIKNIYPSVVTVGTKCLDDKGNEVNIDNAMVSLEYSRLLSIFNKNEYQRLRKKEYDKLNQLEMQYDDFINNTTTWQDKINEIKLMYPKPSDS